MVFPPYQLFEFIDFKIIQKKIIMLSIDELKLDNFWYVRDALMMKNFIKVFNIFQVLKLNFCNFQNLSYIALKLAL